MRTQHTVPLALLALSFFPAGLIADEPATKTADLAKKPITTAPGKVGDLLRRWWKDGAVAGNVGDFYDNRDGGHSDLNTAPYPQLQRIVYTAEDIKLRRHWAAQRITLPHVVFGNSSTSAPFLLGGSNPRMYYTAANGLAFLYHHYTHNNIYIYPEHRDHDPGHNGSGDGYGDAYPTNTPYLIISQGSSGSDQPFMRAIPFTLAAFRPEVKKKLVGTGLLMPTLQMILRSTSRLLKDRGDYLTGKAHPTVFEGSAVDDLKMVQLAHAIKADDIPPMVQLSVVEEDQPVLGKDFFEAGGTEKLADTPASISRIVRGKDYRRRLVVDAGKSFDVNKRPLKFHWAILRGDAERIAIKPLDEAGAKAEIVVGYQGRRPIAPGSAMESNRVDIGVFVRNGTYYSAPGFVTLFSLDSEARTYDEQKRIVEIGHGMGETTLAVQDWPKFLRNAGTDSFAGQLLPLSKNERDLLSKSAVPYQELEATLRKLQEQRKAMEKAKDAATLKIVEKEIAVANQKLQAFRERPQPGAKDTLQTIATRALQALARKPALLSEHAAEFASLHASAAAAQKKSLETARTRLKQLGCRADEKSLQMLPLGERRTSYDSALLEQYQGEVLANLVYPGIVSSKFQVNYADPRLSAPRTWRDVYRHDAKGRCLGWTRYAPEGKTGFNADGFAILRKDSLGRCLQGRTVRYAQEPAKKFQPNATALKQVAGDEIVLYEYNGDGDVVGRIKKREKKGSTER